MGGNRPIPQHWRGFFAVSRHVHSSPPAPAAATAAARTLRTDPATHGDLGELLVLAPHRGDGLQVAHPSSVRRPGKLGTELPDDLRSRQVLRLHCLAHAALGVSDPGGPLFLHSLLLSRLMRRSALESQSVRCPAVRSLPVFSASRGRSVAVLLVMASAASRERTSVSVFRSR